MKARHWLLLPGLAALAWMAGFAWFVDIAWRAPQTPPRADGIVVLTGGAERVSAGLRLLQDDAADRLLVSGVGRNADFPALAHLAGVNHTLAPRVTLGRMAVTTHGNALETADWAATHHIASLIVVTAGYHMPRALVELRQTMPDVVLYPVGVQPRGMHASELTTWRLLAGEYTKFLAAKCGLTDLAERLGFGSPAEHGG
jgi:uncharacterized SAM-binding protein YcdF (DUF218 family)